MRGPALSLSILSVLAACGDPVASMADEGAAPGSRIAPLVTDTGDSGAAALPTPADSGLDAAPDQAPTAAPEISEIVIPSSVPAGDTLQVSWRVTSDAGLGTFGDQPGTWMVVSGASGFVAWCAFPSGAALVSGDGSDGTYAATCDLPITAPNDAYSVSIAAVDALGQRSEVSEAGGFSVRGGSDDLAPPASSDLSITPAVARPGDTVTVRFRLQDDAGVAYAVPWVAGINGLLTDPNGTTWVDYAAATLVGGDVHDGTWEAALPLRADLPAGVYTLSFSLGDVVGNETYEWSSTAAPSFEIAP